MNIQTRRVNGKGPAWREIVVIYGKRSNMTTTPAYFRWRSSGNEMVSARSRKMRILATGIHWSISRIEIRIWRGDRSQIRQEFENAYTLEIGCFVTADILHDPGEVWITLRWKGSFLQASRQVFFVEEEEMLEGRDIAGVLVCEAGSAETHPQMEQGPGNPLAAHTHS